MKLLAKFNLMLILLFGIGLLLVSQLSRRFLENNVREQTIQQAKLMLSSAQSTREGASRIHRFHASRLRMQSGELDFSEVEKLIEI